MKKTKTMKFLFHLLGALLIAIIPLMAVPPSANADVEPATVTFQDGLDGYTGTRDTYIWDDNPDTVRGGEDTIVQDINTE